MPPLRERRDEISHLTEFFIDRYARRYNRPVRQLSDELRAAVPDLRLAGQHPRAREHDQADRDPPGRVAGRARDVARGRPHAAYAYAGVVAGVVRGADARTSLTMPDAMDADDEPQRRRASGDGAGRLAARRRREGGGAESRADASSKTRCTQVHWNRRRAAEQLGRQLQDLAQQDQRVWHQSEVVRQLPSAQSSTVSPH